MTFRHVSFLLLLALSLPMAANAGDDVNLTDRFDDSVIDATKWSIGTLSLFQGASLTDLSIPVTEESGHLKIVPKDRVSGLHYNGYVSRKKYDFTGGRFTVEIVEIPNPGSTGEMFISVGADGQNLYRFEIHEAQLRADIVTNGIPTYYPLGQSGSSSGVPPPPGPYGYGSPAAISAYYPPPVYPPPPVQNTTLNLRHLRIRHDPAANLILWEASSNRLDWTTLYSKCPAFALTNVQVELFAGTYTPASSPGFAIFDNVELSTISLVTNQPPRILTQPQAKTVSIGQSATFSIDALSLDPISYQWYLNSFFISGATSAVFTVTNVQPGNAGSYRVIVTNKAGVTISTAAELIVLDLHTGPPVIITQPKDVANAVEGDAASFTVVADGTRPLEYGWFKDSQPITGATGSTLTLSSLIPGSASYQVVVRNAIGSVTSRAAVLVVSPKGNSGQPPIITRQPRATEELLEGNPLTLSFSAAGSPPLNFQWFKDGAPIRGATTESLIFPITFVEDHGIYTATATNPYGSVTTGPVFVTIHPLPIVIQSEPPAASAARKGDPLSLSIAATGDVPFSFQWFHDDQPIAGATSATLTIPRTDFPDAGYYHALVSSRYGVEIASSRYAVSIQGEPLITQQPPEQVNLLPKDLVYSLTAQAIGTYPLEAFWYRNGGPPQPGSVLGIGNSVVRSVFPIVGGTDSGDYVVVFRSAFGSVTSRVARVQVTVQGPRRPPSTAPSRLLDGLVAYWPLDEFQDNELKDAVGRYDLQLDFSFNSRPSLVPGRHGGALGITKYDKIAKFQSQNVDDELPISKQPAFTVAFWAKYEYGDGYPEQGCYFREGNSEDNQTGFAFSTSPRNRDLSGLYYSALLQFNNEPLEKVEVMGNILLTRGLWHHFTLVQEEDGHRWLYVNGVEDDVVLPDRPADGVWKLNYTGLDGPRPQPPGTLSALFGPVPDWHILDEVAVWKRALTAEEIRLLITDGIPGFAPKPLAIQSCSVDRAEGLVSLQWIATDEASYSLLKSANANGPWTVVKSMEPYEIRLTNVFTDLSSDRNAFYRISRTPQ